MVETTYREEKDWKRTGTCEPLKVRERKEGELEGVYY